MKTTTSIPSWVLLALLALTSAIMCIASPDRRLVYGVLLGVYFFTCYGIRSWWRLIALVLVAAVAWPTAYLGSMFALGIPGATVHHGDAVDPAFPLISFGGVLGGAALLIPVLLLFKPSSITWRTALVKAPLGIALSGIVGGIAWQLGPTLGAALWNLLPTAPVAEVRREESYPMANFCSTVFAVPNVREGNSADVHVFRWQ